MLTTLLEIVAPVFALVALGWLVRRRGWMGRPAFDGLSLFVFAIASPALLFSGGTRPHEGGLGAALALLAGGVVLFALVAFGARRAGGMALTEASLLALAAVFGNSVMMGIPVVFAAYGQAGVGPLLGILAFQTIVLLGLATVLAEVGQNARAPWRQLLRATLAGIGRNPVVLSVLAALAWKTLGLPLPEVARRTLDFVGAAAPPVALFCLGGSLVGVAAAAAWRETAAVAAVKLLAMPALVWAIAVALGLSAIDTAVAVTIAAMPTGANAFIVAQRYAQGPGGGADRSGAAVVVTTAASVVTLSLVIGWFRATLG